MKKFFDYTAPEIVKPEEKPEETTVETDTVETETVQTEEEIMKLAYSNLYNLMAKNNIAMDTFYNYAMQLEEENNINIEKVEELKLKTA